VRAAVANAQRIGQLGRGKPCHGIGRRTWRKGDNHAQGAIVGQAPWAMAGLAKAALVKPSKIWRRCLIIAGCLSVWFIRENPCPRFKKSLGLTKRRGTYELTLQGESVP
jgi:hypothetical protein